MAQCKDCIHGEICDMFAHVRTLICADRADKMCKMFKATADVVPKSEVEKIFEEIERFLYMHFRFCKEESGNDDTKYLEGRLELNTQMQDLIAELKKKYPEEQNDT